MDREAAILDIHNLTKSHPAIDAGGLLGLRPEHRCAAETHHHLNELITLVEGALWHCIRRDVLEVIILADLDDCTQPVIIDVLDGKASLVFDDGARRQPDAITHEDDHLVEVRLEGLEALHDARAPEAKNGPVVVQHSDWERSVELLIKETDAIDAYRVATIIQALTVCIDRWEMPALNDIDHARAVCLNRRCCDACDVVGVLGPQRGKLLSVDVSPMMELSRIVVEALSVWHDELTRKDAPDVNLRTLKVYPEEARAPYACIAERLP